MKKGFSKKSTMDILVKRIMIVVGQLFMAGSMLAQSATPVGGGNAQNESGSMSYTIGQVDYLFSKSQTGNAVAGVQQPFDDNTAYHSLCDGVNLTIYPNPTSADVYVVSDALDSSYPYMLTDLNGRIMYEGKMTGEYTTVATSNLIAGSYLLKIICGDEDTDKSVFKILKK